MIFGVKFNRTMSPAFPGVGGTVLAKRAGTVNGFIN